jgi:glutamyl endopeptidase
MVEFGKEDRKPIVKFGYPWNCTCFLETNGSGGKTGRASGALIGPRAVLTAGHVFHEFPPDDPDKIGDVSEVNVIPGGYGSGMSRIHLRKESIKFDTGDNWKNTQNRKYDYACVILPQSESRSQYFGIEKIEPSDFEKLNDNGVTLAGFPNDPDLPGGSGKLWYQVGPIDAIDSYYITHTFDTNTSNSGGPLFILGNNGTYDIVGIHLGGGVGKNKARLFSTDMIPDIQKWAAIK